MTFSDQVVADRHFIIGRCNPIKARGV